MVKKSDVGVWMDNEDRFESVARMIAWQRWGWITSTTFERGIRSLRR